MNTEEVSNVFGMDPLAAIHKSTDVAEEHGATFVSCLDCGASWSVHETSGPEGFTFEELSQGDGYCQQIVNGAYRRAGRTKRARKATKTVLPSQKTLERRKAASDAAATIAEGAQWSKATILGASRVVAFLDAKLVLQALTADPARYIAFTSEERTVAIKTAKLREVAKALKTYGDGVRCYLYPQVAPRPVKKSKHGKMAPVDTGKVDEVLGLSLGFSWKGGKGGLLFVNDYDLKPAADTVKVIAIAARPTERLETAPVPVGLGGEAARPGANDNNAVAAITASVAISAKDDTWSKPGCCPTCGQALRAKRAAGDKVVDYSAAAHKAWETRRRNAAAKTGT